jgi:hypothetical protein
LTNLAWKVHGRGYGDAACPRPLRLFVHLPIFL